MYVWTHTQYVRTQTLFSSRNTVGFQAGMHTARSGTVRQANANSFWAKKMAVTPSIACNARPRATSDSSSPEARLRVSLDWSGESIDIRTGSTEAVHTAKNDGQHKSRICLQILHTDLLAVSAISTKSPISPFPARALSAAGIQQISMITSARQIWRVPWADTRSWANLLSQSLSPRTNQRTDEYGEGSIENRA